MVSSLTCELKTYGEGGREMITYCRCYLRVVCCGHFTLSIKGNLKIYGIKQPAVIRQHQFIIVTVILIYTDLKSIKKM